MIASNALAQIPAQILDRTDPASYSCAEFIGAGTPASRERAERMFYWAAGYVRGRLKEVATGDAHTWRFEDLAGHVTRALFERCRGEPSLSIADMAERIVHDLSRTGMAEHRGPDDPH